MLRFGEDVLIPRTLGFTLDVMLLPPVELQESLSASRVSRDGPVALSRTDVGCVVGHLGVVARRAHPDGREGALRPDRRPGDRRTAPIMSAA